MGNHAARPPAALSTEHSNHGLIGDCALIHHLHDLLERLSRSNFPVLLLGETGTGKELVARAIHLTGLRREKAFVPVGCCALTPALVESELFGHVNGAFTGADHSKLGLLETANEGMIFLDEIGELPLFLQAKLLRALQEKELELRAILHAIRETEGDKLAAAVILGSGKTTLYRKLEQYGHGGPRLRAAPVWKENSTVEPFLICIHHKCRHLMNLQERGERIADWPNSRGIAPNAATSCPASVHSARDHWTSFGEPSFPIAHNVTAS
jgi:transcriptional regulator with GAF, ATPase, and Fis domain